VEDFKYLRTTLTHQNSIEEEIKSGLKLWKCLLSFGAESFALQFAILKYEGSHIQDHNFTCYFYGCETWLLTSRKEHRLRFFENWVLWRIFGPKREEVTRKRRKVHNKELN